MLIWGIYSMTKKWYSVREASQYFDLNQKTLYTLIGKGQITADAVLRLGRQIRIDIKRIEEQKGTIDAGIRR